jgi:hypothetical protein
MRVAASRVTRNQGERKLPDKAAVPDTETASSALTDDERSQIAGRLRLSPNERLSYLEDMIAFEETARQARRLT